MIFITMLAAVTFNAEAERFDFSNNPIPTFPSRPPLGSSNLAPKCLADLEAHSFRYDIIERHFKYNARVRITGTILKKGDLVYRAEQQPATITIYRDSPQWPVKSTTISRLDSGQYSLSFEEEWDASSPAEGEFPWKFILVISDENKHCNKGNNRKEWSSSPINSYLRSSSG